MTDDFLAERLPPSPRPKAPLIVALVTMMLLLVAIAGFAYWNERQNASPAAKIARQIQTRRKVVPASIVPAVEPLKLVPLAHEDARAVNDRVPFVMNGVVRAQPFRFTGPEADRERAVGCLAAAVLYEAGDDAVGERSVAQVVLNRVRHPAFPSTVCGVVFQGAERATGCQFTFTCDGALARRYSAAATIRAEAVARAAIDGAVDGSVGYATHYHTDWVVPYWSSSLDKIAKVGTHLFFRWTGWWGTPPAFRSRHAGSEPVIASLAPLFTAHRPLDPAAPTDAAAATGEVPVAVDPSGGAPASAAADESALRVAPAPGNGDILFATLPPGLRADRLPVLAERACAARTRCVFMAWSDGKLTPSALPVGTSQLQSMAFHYIRDPALAAARARWNCTIWVQDDRGLCLSHQR